MANVIKLKSSVVAGKIPTTSDISKGEVAVNYADAKIFGRHPSTDAIIELGAGGGGCSCTRHGRSSARAAVEGAGPGSSA